MILFKYFNKILVKFKIKFFKIPNPYFHWYLVDINYLIKNINFDNFLIFLRKNNFRLNKDQKVKFTEILLICRDNYVQGKNFDLNIYKSELSLHKLTFNWHEHYLLSRLFFFLGLTFISFYHRKKYEEYFINKEFKYLNTYEKITYFKVVFENCEYFKNDLNKKKFIENRLIKKLFKTEHKSINLIYKLLNKQEIVSEENSEFKKLIANKSIAIIGPADNKDFNKKELENFDLIIQPSIFDEENILDKTKTITFYSKFNTGKFLAMHNHGKTEFSKSLKFICCKGETNEIQKYYNNLRTFDTKINLCAGKEQIIQHVINDLILHSPKKIKLFSVDFYLNQNNYNPTYSGNKLRNLNLLELSRENQISMSYHDTLSQINHIKTYVKLKYIEVDEFISNIISKEEKNIQQMIFNKYENTYKASDYIKKKINISF